jgi:CHAT domain-containing protein/tetratricopeptide (TPR) repeat protein
MEMSQWQAKATALLGVSLALGLVCEGRPPAESEPAQLVAALGPCRPLEGRVTGLAYAPFPKCPTPSLDRREVIAQLRRRSTTLSAKALLQIVARNWEAAASLLRAASTEMVPSAAAPDRARLESDLAAVALARSSRDDDPYELTFALAAANRAIRLDHRLPEAYFNLALAEERLFLIGHASADWQRYLKLDPRSPWAAEAERHIARLAALAAGDWPAERVTLDAAALRGDLQEVARLVARFRQPVRLYGEELLGEWARNAQRGDEGKATSSLRRLTVIARALRGQTGDRLLDEAASLLQQSTSSRRRALITGHLAFAKAYNLIKAERFADAEKPLRIARRDLARAGSPMALWAGFQQAAIAYREKRQEEALRTARDLAETAAARSYSALSGRTGWLVGLILLERTEASAAIEALQPALVRFDRNGEIGNQGSILSMLAAGYEYLGAPHEAWKFRLRALRAIVLSGDTGRSLVLFGSAAQALAREGMPELGLLYEDEALTGELASGNPLGIAEAYWIRGMIHHQAGAERQAAADLGEATRYCRRIQSAASRRHTEAVIASTQGAVEREHDPAAAVGTLTRSLLQFQSERFPFLTVEVLFDRALAFLALGDLQRAEADLEAGIAEYENQRRQMHGATSRVSFFDRAEQIFDVMIRFQVDRRRRPDLAFAYAERAKARALLDAVAAIPECPSMGHPCRPEKTLDAASLMAALPSSMALVEMHVMEDRTLVWLFCRGLSSFWSLDMGAAKVAGLASRLSAAVRTGHDPAAFEEISSQLYELLLAPLAGKLPPDVGLVFVTDKEIQSVPIAALLNRQTGRFLIQEHPLLVAASASTYCLRLERGVAPATAGTPFTVLAVGNPELDHTHFPELGPLPGAEREAERTASFYPGSVVLRGKEATVASFLAELDRHDLVQFAGHAVSRPGRQASLMFAPLGGGPDMGELETGLVAGLRLHRPQLVILSACAAGSGPAARLEGTFSLARAFLAAGVPVVLANLWTVGDDVALAFSDRFHASFKRRRNALAALQDAQAAMLSSPDARFRAPAAWAGFQLFGAAGTSGVEEAPAGRSTATPHQRLSPRSPPM